MEDDGYKEGKDFRMVPMMDSKGKPVLDGKGKPVMTRKFFTRAEKAAASKPATQAETKPAARSRSSSAPSTSKRPQARNNLVQIAQEGLDKAERGPSRRAGPRRKAEISTERPSGPKGPSPLAASETSGPRGTKPFAGTKPTREEWENMSVTQRIRWGVLAPPKREGGNTQNAGTTAGRRDRRKESRGMAMGGMVKKSGYAKGGMVKSNCGASMKPTQKSTKGK